MLQCTEALVSSHFEGDSTTASWGMGWGVLGGVTWPTVENRKKKSELWALGLFSREKVVLESFECAWWLQCFVFVAARLETTEVKHTHQIIKVIFSVNCLTVLLNTCVILMYIYLHSFTVKQSTNNEYTEIWSPQETILWTRNHAKTTRKTWLIVAKQQNTRGHKKTLWNLHSEKCCCRTVDQFNVTCGTLG